MKFARFVDETNREIKYAVVNEDSLHEIEGDLFSEWKYTGHTFSFEQVKLLAPLFSSLQPPLSAPAMQL